MAARTVIIPHSRTAPKDNIFNRAFAVQIDFDDKGIRSIPRKTQPLSGSSETATPDGGLVFLTGAMPSAASRRLADFKAEWERP